MKERPMVHRRRRSLRWRIRRHASCHVLRRDVSLRTGTHTIVYIGMHKYVSTCTHARWSNDQSLVSMVRVGVQ